MPSIYPVDGDSGKSSHLGTLDGVSSEKVQRNYRRILNVGSRSGSPPYRMNRILRPAGIGYPLALQKEACRASEVLPTAVGARLFRIFSLSATSHPYARDKMRLTSTILRPPWPTMSGQEVR